MSLPMSARPDRKSQSRWRMPCSCIGGRLSPRRPLPQRITSSGRTLPSRPSKQKGCVCVRLPLLRSVPKGLALRARRGSIHSSNWKCFSASPPQRRRRLRTTLIQSTDSFSLRSNSRLTLAGEQQPQPRLVRKASVRTDRTSSMHSRNLLYFACAWQELRHLFRIESIPSDHKRPSHLRKRRSSVPAGRTSGIVPTPTLNSNSVTASLRNRSLARSRSCGSTL